MSDLRIQYDEEMVGAGHPTKNDTLNRLTMADHAEDGSHFHRGYISGMQPKCTAEGSTVKIGPGVVEQGGKIYKLESEITKTASLNTGGSLQWKCIYIKTLPSSGNVLTDSHIGTDGLSLTSQSATDGLFYRNGTQRVIGLYPTMSSVVKRFFTYGGRYHLRYLHTLLDESSPATSSTDLNICFPALGVPVRGCIHMRTTVSGAVNATGFQLNINGISPVRLQFPYPNNCGAYYTTMFEVPDWDGDSMVGYYVSAVQGNISDFRLLLDGVDIPAGMAG